MLFFVFLRFQFEIDPNDEEIFDAERMSGSFRYDEELDQTAETTDYETIRKSKKNSVTKRFFSRQKKISDLNFQQNEKQRQKSASRTRTSKSIAKIVQLDGSEEDFELKVSQSFSALR